MLHELGEPAPFRHPRVWTRQPTSGPERLLIGGGEAPVDVLSELAGALAEPLFVLVVLRVPRAGEAAKLESDALTHAELVGFLGEFRDLFENDGRAQAWVGATVGGEGLVVLDEHDLIYAYGPLDTLEAVLSARGYERGEPHVPDDHEHHYRPENDELEVRLRGWWDWRRVLPAEDAAG